MLPPYFYDRNLIDRLSRYQVPAVIIQGKNDTFVPRAHAEAHATGFASARMEIIPDLGHSVVAESPEEAAAAVGTFLRT